MLRFWLDTLRNVGTDLLRSQHAISIQARISSTEVSITYLRELDPKYIPIRTCDAR